jgi:NAD(P)-dependent dehydrogenase (short-subunit alcohol dehydrogenase family)
MPAVLITGTNRGIGLGFVRHYAEDGWDVIACCRNPSAAVDLMKTADQSGGRVQIESLDIADHASVDALAKKYAGKPIDVLINNAGVSGPRDPNREQLYRQRFGTIDYEAWEDVFRINTMGPLKVAEAFVDNVAASEGKKIVTLSSTMGSIQEGTMPVFLYGSSKAAVNKVVAMMATDLKQRGIIAVIFCPGHVKTELGGADATVEVDDSVAGMRKMIAALTLDDSGSYTRYNGETVAW